MTALSELGPHKEHFHRVRGVMSDLAARTTSRLLVEHLGLPTIHTPLGGWGGLTTIDGFWDDVKEGSRAYFTMYKGMHTSSINRGFVQFTMQEAPVLFEDLGFAVSHRIHRADERPILPAIAQVMVTLAYLGSYPQVRFTDLDAPEYEQRAGDFGGMPSFWENEITPDYFWEMVKRLQDGVKEALFTEGSLPKVTNVIHATHFFVAGEKLIQQIAVAFEDASNTIIHLPNET